MIIERLIKSLRGCSHEKVDIRSGGGYCPDCGRYVVIKWYLVRCSCCNVKRVGYNDFNDNVKPVDKFCPNCGSTNFYLEECSKINFVDVNFAVHKREVIPQIAFEPVTQLWTENNSREEQILITAKPA